MIFFSAVLGFIVMVLLFSLTIFIHELGHLVVALMCKMEVDVFSIGFGPALWEREWRGVKWRISVFPLGGYVALPQLDPEAMSAVQGDNAGNKEEQEADEDTPEKPVDLSPAVAPWKKIVVSLAGATGNVILAVIISWIIYLVPNAPIVRGEPVVGVVATNAPAYAAGLRIGDRITAVRGDKIKSWDAFQVECALVGKSTNRIEVAIKRDGESMLLLLPVKYGDGIEDTTRIEGIAKSYAVAIVGVSNGWPSVEAGLQTNDVVVAVDGTKVLSAQHLGRLVSGAGATPIVMTIKREDSETGKPVTKEIRVTPRWCEEYGRYRIGIEMAPAQIYFAWMQYKTPKKQLLHDAGSVGRILRALGSKRKGESTAALGSMGGPALILTITWLSAQAGFLVALGFIRMININLALLNLLPIPVLDGGHIVFALYEWISGRRIHPKVANTLVNIFAVLLIGAMLVLTFWRDSLRLWKMFSHDEPEPTAAEQSTNAPAAEGVVTNQP